jgi:diketogulonate reductase-like aldo/keto reductase
MMPCILFCAADYKNEKEVGVALAEGMKMGLAKREELFITTKVCCFLSKKIWDALALHFDMAF